MDAWIDDSAQDRGEGEDEDDIKDGTCVLLIPPKAVDERLLTRDFVRLRSEQERGLYTLLKLQEPAKGEFYGRFVLPRLHDNALPDEVTDAVSVAIVQNLSQLEKDRPGLSEQLSSCPFIRCSTKILVPPRHLYDPVNSYKSYNFQI
jgi:hypothetical protein